MIKTANSKHREEGRIGLTVERGLAFLYFLKWGKKEQKGRARSKDAPLRLRIAVWSFGFVSDFEIRTSSF